jgi:hypothetical protein
MSNSSGYAKTLMVLDFQAFNGVTVVAEPNTWLSPSEADAQARMLHEQVKKAEEDDYALYADGRFDFRACVEKELQAVGAKLIVYYDNDA